MLPREGPFPLDFGPYRVEEFLGGGGFGLVFRAREWDKPVALKVPRPEFGADADSRRRFLDEGRAAFRLPRHPNLILVYRCDEIKGIPFLAMEYMPGGPLRPVLAPDPWDAVSLVHTLALAMQAAHEAGVTHRDLKPDNILFAVGARPVITDFGLALRLDDPHAPMPQP